MIIPHRELSPEALRGLLEEFVSRDGTDYGPVEVPLEIKVAQVHAQLDSGKAVILYEDLEKSFTIVFKDQLAENRNGF